MAHADDVGQFHPLDRVDVDGEIPVVDGARLYAQQQGIQSGHHQALDVVGVAVAQGAVQGVGETGHAGLAIPEKGGQGLLRFQRVLVPVVRHARPVEAAHILAPAEDLANEAFDGGNGGMAIAPGGFGVGAGAHRVEQLEVERAGQACVEQPGFAGPHRILELTEAGQPVRDEVLQRGFRLLRRHRPVEVFQAAGVVRKMPFDVLDDLLRARVRCKGQRRRQGARPVPAKAVAVVGIKIPLSTSGLLALHEEPGLLTHAAIEVFHARLLASFQPLRECVARAEKVGIRVHLEGQTARARAGIEGLLDVVLSGLGHAQPIHGHFAQRGSEGIVEGVMRVGPQRQVMHPPTALSELIGKMPHGAEEDRDAGLVRPHLVALSEAFAHPHRVAGGVRRLQGRVLQRQLVAENDDQPVGALRAHGRALRRCLRQRSEQ